MRAIWSPRARRELGDVADYIAKDDPIAAGKWVDRLLDRGELAASMRSSGRVVPEFARDDIREVFVGTYRIVYRTRRGGIYVLTVFEGSMQMPADVDPDAPEP